MARETAPQTTTDTGPVFFVPGTRSLVNDLDKDFPQFPVNAPHLYHSAGAHIPIYVPRGDGSWVPYVANKPADENPAATQGQPSDNSLLSVCRANLLPIIMTIFGGVLIGGLFLFFAAVAGFAGAKPYMVAFVAAGTAFLLGPVSLVIGYLWLETRIWKIR